MLRIEDGLVAEITSFVFPELFAAFGLPPATDEFLARLVVLATTRNPMRKLAVNTFMSLDGVMQAPGGPEEDPTGGFTHGGWAATYFDDEMMERMAESGPYELLLGRGTYEIFAAHWPYDEGPIADHLNGTRKHVASTTLERVEWSNSTLIAGDVADYVAALKGEDGPELQVHGSPGLIQTLLEHDLIDEYRLWIFPVVLGTGKRFFGEGTIPVGAEAGRQQGLEDRRHDQHLRARGRDRHRLVRVRGADRGGARAAQAPRVVVCEHTFVSYVELHCHSAYSFLDGASHPVELAAAAAEQGHEALALTDHDGLHGAMEMAQALKPLGVRPITGAELTLDDGSHLTLLCETREGYTQPLPPDHRRPLADAALGARGLVGAGGAGDRGPAPGPGPARRRAERDAGGRGAPRRGARLPVRLRARRRGGRAHRARRPPRGRGGGPAPAGRLRARPLPRSSCSAPTGATTAAATSCSPSWPSAWGCPASPPATCTRTRASAPRSRTRWSRCGWARRSTRPSPGGAATPRTC